MLEALAPVGAAPFVAASSDCHGSSSFILRSCCRLRDLLVPHAGSSPAHRRDETAILSRRTAVTSRGRASMRVEWFPRDSRRTRRPRTRSRVGSDVGRGRDRHRSGLGRCVPWWSGSEYAFFLIGRSAKLGRRNAGGTAKNGNGTTSRWVPRRALPSGRVPARGRLSGAVMDGDASRPFPSAPQRGPNQSDGGCARAHRPLGMAMRATSRREEAAHASQTTWCSRPLVVRVDAAGDVPNRSDDRVVAMCRWLEWPQAVSGCL